MALGIPLGKHRSIHLGKHKAISHAHTQRRLHGGASVTIDSRSRGYGAGTALAHRPMHQATSHSKKKPLKFKF